MKISFVKNKKNKKFNYSPRFQTKKSESTKKKIVFKKREILIKNNKINKSQLLLLVGLLFLFLYLILN